MEIVLQWGDISYTKQQEIIDMKKDEVIELLLSDVDYLTDNPIRSKARVESDAEDEVETRFRKIYGDVSFIGD